MAATVKARARGLLARARELLGERALPKEVRTALETLESSLKRTWADLESEAAEAEPDLEHEDTKTTKDAKHEDATDAAETPVQEAQGAHVGAPLQDAQGEDTGGTGLTAPLREARNVGQWFEAEIHRNFTMIADGQFGEGHLTRDERIALSSAIGDALDAFARKLSQVAPQLYERDPYGPAPVTEAAGAQPTGEETAVLQERLAGDVVPLVERALRTDGTTRIKVIEPGWGASGYYAPEVLKRDGARAFPAGTHMFVDHPTALDEAERPERSLKELGGVLVSAARWEDDPQGGPGLYADAKVFSPFGQVLEEMAPHIGVSINAAGVVREGQAEGRNGRIVASIQQGRSVDFVTRAGAGGKVMPLVERALYESQRRGAIARSGEPTSPATNGTQNTALTEGAGMNEEELKALREAKAAADEQVARLQEALLLREARDVAATELAKMELPEPTRNRLLEAQAKRPVIVEGKLDTEAFAAQVREAATAELAYLVEATGAGRITGMGAQPDDATSLEASEAKLNEAFRGLGLSDSLAAKAARGR